MLSKNDISVVLIVKNEEKNIEDCLETVKWADEIIIVDQGSSDQTVKLARKYTNKIFVTEPKLICNPDRMFGISKAQNKWILLLEADERVCEDLKNEIIRAIEVDNLDVYYIPVKTFFLGKWIKNCGWYPAYVLRLFKKGKAKFADTIHDKGTPLTQKVGYLKNALLHYSYNSMSDWISKFERYTSQIALEDYKNYKKVNFANTLIDVIFRPLYFFLFKFFWLGGYKDGLRGLFISISSALTIMFSYFKLYELHLKNKHEKSCH